MTLIIDIPLHDDLKGLGVIQFKKQGGKSLLLNCKDNKNNKNTVSIFPISKNGPYDTLMNFDNAAKGKMNKTIIEEIKAVLSQEDNGYLEFLLYDGSNGKTNGGNGCHATISEQQQEEGEKESSTDNDTWYLDSNKLSAADNSSPARKKRCLCNVRNLDYKNSILDMLIDAVRSEHKITKDA